jgi:hypothetical protein
VELLEQARLGLFELASVVGGPGLGGFLRLRPVELDTDAARDLRDRRDASREVPGDLVAGFPRADLRFDAGPFVVR